MAKVNRRGGFSDRNEIKPVNTDIQLSQFDGRTRVQLQNMMSQIYSWAYNKTLESSQYGILQDYYKYVLYFA